MNLWAFALPLWAYVLMGFCPRGFCPRGFSPRGFCPDTIVLVLVLVLVASVLVPVLVLEATVLETSLSFGTRRKRVYVCSIGDTRYNLSIFNASGTVTCILCKLAILFNL